MKKLVICIVVVMASLVPAISFFQDPLLAAGFYIANEAKARGQRREASTGLTLFNIYHIRDDGEAPEFAGVWDPYTQHLSAWGDDVVLVPIPIVNSSKSPRKVEVSISNSRGANRKIAFLGMKGGRPGRDGKSVDNAGYTDPLPTIAVKDLPEGANAIQVSWGGGVAQPAIFVKEDRTKILQELVADHSLRKALSGAGGAMAPRAQISPVVIGGETKFFLSKEEMDLYMQQKAQGITPDYDLDEADQRSARPSDDSYRGGDDQKEPAGKDEMPTRPAPEESFVNVRTGVFYNPDVLTYDNPVAYLRSLLVRQSPKASDDRTLTVPTNEDYRLGVYYTSDKPFEVSLGRKTVASDRDGDGYYYLIRIYKYDPGSRGAELIVSAAGHRPMRFHFAETEVKTR